MDDVERDDLGYSETDMSGADWAEPMQSLRAAEEEGEEASDDTAGEEEGEWEDESLLREELALDNSVGAARLR